MYVTEEYSKRVGTELELGDAFDEDEEEAAHSGEGPGILFYLRALYHTHLYLIFDSYIHNFPHYCYCSTSHL